ncbi:hypothetical protein [Hyphomonas sp.]|uniref:hypothetical protein n=1 Tax=Hyphomonas sp. TaxID=87 RepID=UPI0035679DA1
MPRSLLLAAALVLFALPATAQRTDYMNGNYQHGVESGAVPQTAANTVACATHWAVWSQSAATDWDADFIADLDPDLRPAESQLAAGYWATMASNRYEAETGDTALFEHEIGIATPQAIQSYSNLMTSSDARVRYHMFRILGACHLSFE